VTNDKKRRLRSARWYEADDLRSFGHRSRTLQTGLRREDFMGKPVIAVINTWSDLNPCHSHLRTRADEVKRGVWLAGGYPVELPAMSLGETFMRPTTMLYRNLLAMETEELLRSNPIDGAVLLGGCDKTLPAMVMGALSAGLPAIVMPAGPMLRGTYAGKYLGSGTDVWKYWADRRAGLVSEESWRQMEEGIARSFGTCMTMGTASTMAITLEAMGLTMPGAATIPAADSRHSRMAAETGARIVSLVREAVTLSSIVTSESVYNAIVALSAIGGSTNAVIHLMAIARRASIELPLKTFDDVARKVGVIANIRPAGQFLMEDLFEAGGSQAILNRVLPLLHQNSITVCGQTVGEAYRSAPVWRDDIIRTLDNPIAPQGSIAIVTGNLAPDGAVIKPAAAEQRLLKHRGPALVFDSYDSMTNALDQPDLDVSADSVLILRNAGPVGGPGMPEWGMLPLPAKLLKIGIRDMLRISDARMSGTSYGACVLHVAPESAVGGPLAAVETGDFVSIDIDQRKLTLELTENEIARRLISRRAIPQRKFAGGYTEDFVRHVQQANLGCDFDYLSKPRGVFEPEIH
jgi:dihydroxy-acid dehydratase